MKTKSKKQKESGLKSKSKKELKQIEADKQKRESEAIGMKLIVSAEKGRKIAEEVAFAQPLKDLQRTLAKNFELTSTGLTLNKGAHLSGDEWGCVIGGFLQSTESFKRAAGSSMWAAGDAILAVRETMGPEEADNLILNIVNERGVEPHSVRIAENTCRGFARDERNPNVSFTMHVEALSYSKQWKELKKAKVLKMLEEAERGKTVTIKSKDGSEETRMEPISVKEFRSRLQDAVGKTTTKKSKQGTNGSSHSDATVDTGKYYYIDSEGNVRRSSKVRLDLVKSGNYIVIDVVDDTVLKDDGSLYYSIKEVDPVEPEPKEEVKEEPKKEEPKVEKPKAEKPKKKTKSSIPE